MRMSRPLAALLSLAFAGAAERDWSGEIRAALQSGESIRAEQIADEWMEASPRNAEARLWHAQPVSWSRSCNVH